MPLAKEKCVVDLEPLSARDLKNFKSPQLLHRVQPLYPQGQLRAHREATVRFEANMTEHGTVTNPRYLEPLDAPDEFKFSAQLAAGLWEFAPGALGDCHVRMKVNYRMTYVLQ